MRQCSAASSRRILLADEQASSRDLVGLVLSKLGYQVETAASSTELSTRLRSDSFALVLLSAGLAGGACPALMEQSERAPIVLIGQGDKPHGPVDEVAPADHLDRPIDIERLLRVVERLLRHRAPEPMSVAADEPVMDLAHLHEFTDGDPLLESELLELFLSSAEVYLDRMGHALQSGQPWSAFAHALKGAGANLGARRVSALAQTAEHAAPSSALLDTIRLAINEVREFGNTRRG